MAAAVFVLASFVDTLLFHFGFLCEFAFFVAVFRYQPIILASLADSLLSLLFAGSLLVSRLRIHGAILKTLPRLSISLSSLLLNIVERLLDRPRLLQTQIRTRLLSKSLQLLGNIPVRLRQGLG